MSTNFLIVDTRHQPTTAPSEPVEAAPPHPGLQEKRGLALLEKKLKMELEKKLKMEKAPVDPRVFAAPPRTDQSVGSVSAATKVVIPASAQRFAEVALGIRSFQSDIGKLLSLTARQGGSSLLSGVISCLPWIGALGMLIAGNGVGVAAFLGSSGVVRTVRKPKYLGRPIDGSILANLRKVYEAAAADADPIGAVALRRSVVKALESAKSSRGLTPEVELYLQDLRYTTNADPEIEGVGERAAATGQALGSSVGVHVTLPELHPYEAVALAARHAPPSAGYHDSGYAAVRSAGSWAQEKIDAAVSADIDKRLNPELL